MKTGSSMRSVRAFVKGLLRPACAVMVAVPLSLNALPAKAETQGFVISWFAMATNIKNVKEACREDRNGGGLQLAIRNLMDIGYSREEATEMANNPAIENRSEIQEKIIHRVSVSGKPVSVYNYPEAVKDPNIETVSGPYAYGFDLGGKPQSKFTDPETGQKIDNQLWRAVGCTDSYRAVPPQMPYPEELSWNTMTDSAPAWAIQISGDDLSKDGKVSVIMSRALQHLERDATGGIIRNATYTVDPSPPSYNVLTGEIRNGVLTIDPKDVYLEGEMPFYAEIALKNAQLRIKRQPDGKLLGYIGGHFEWQRFVYMYTARPANGADSIGIYHAVKKMADAYPDPKTGENRFISSTFRLEAVPAFLVSLDGALLASPPGMAARAVTVADNHPASSGATSK